MKSFKIIGTFFVLISALLIILYMNLPKKDIITSNKSSTSTGCSTNQGQVSCGTDIASSGDINEIKDTKVILGRLSKIEELQGKPSFLRWAWKFCAYCRDKVPEVEELIQNQFGDKIHLQMMTMNFESSTFSTSIPQTPYDTFNYKDFTNETCDEFPTRVILDKKGNLVAKECGGKTTIEEASEQIKLLIDR